MRDADEHLFNAERASYFEGIQKLGELILLSWLVLRPEKPFPSLSQRVVEGNQGRSRRVLVATINAISGETQADGGDNDPR